MCSSEFINPNSYQLVFQIPPLYTVVIECSCCVVWLWVTTISSLSRTLCAHLILIYAFTRTAKIMELESPHLVGCAEFVWSLCPHLLFHRYWTILCPTHTTFRTSVPTLFYETCCCASSDACWCMDWLIVQKWWCVNVRREVHIAALPRERIIDKYNPTTTASAMGHIPPRIKAKNAPSNIGFWESHRALSVNAGESFPNW